MRILAAVYNSIDFDGRVQRACEALSVLGNVAVVSIDSGKHYRHEKFASFPIRLPRRLGVTAHFWFWLGLWMRALAIRPAIIHAHDFFMAFPGWVAAKITGAKLVYDAHELIIPDPELRMSPQGRFWYLLERWSVTRAELVIAANVERAQLMKEHYGLAHLPLVIRNIPPAAAPVVANSEILLRYPFLEHRSEEDCLIVYQGDISISRGLGPFIAAMRLLPSQFRLAVVGGGPDAGLLRANSKKQGLDGRIVFTGKVPLNELHDILRQCEIGIITYSQTGRNNLLCAPNKIYEYAQAGLVVMCSANPVLNALLEEYQIGLTASGPIEIAAALRRLHKDRAVYRQRLPRFLLENRWEDEAIRLREAISRL